MDGGAASTGRDAIRRQRTRWFQRYVLNPPVLVLVRLGLAPGYVLLETRGRATGKRRRTVVGVHFDDDGGPGWIVAEQGRHAGYVRNVAADPEVRVCRRGHWRPALATVLLEDDAQARLDSFHRRTHAAVVRRFGTDLTTLRLDLT